MRFPWIAPILCTALAACTSFKVERQEVFLRYDPGTDVLDAVLVYEGIGSNKHSNEDVEQSTRLIESMGDGERHVLVWDWPFELDLGEEGLRKLREAESSEPLDAFLAWESNLSIERARLLRQGSGKLCLVQRVRAREVRGLLHVLDLVAASSEFDPSPTDARTQELLRQRASNSQSWLRFDANVLEVSIPASSEQAAQWLREVLGAARPKDDAPAWAQALTSIAVTGEEIRLRFAPASDGWIAFRLRDSRRAVGPEVSEALSASPALASSTLADEVARAKASADR